MSSLFPAYSLPSGHDTSSANASGTQADDITGRTEWLKNTSFVNTDAEKLQQLHAAEARCSSQQKEMNERSSGRNDAKPPKRNHYVTEDLFCSEDSDQDNDDRHNSHEHSKKQKTILFGSGTEDENNRRKRHHSKKKKKKTKKHKDHKYKKPRTKEVKFSSSLVKEDGKIFIEDFDKMPADCAFYFDKSSDKSNFTYQSIYKMHIASYWQTHHGLGATDMHNKGKKTTKKSVFDRYYSLKMKSDLKEEDDITFVEPEQIICDHELSVKAKPILEDFMPLSEDPSNRQICATETKQSELTSNILDVSQSRKSALQKQEEYNRKLRENCNNVNLWLEFIHFQDEFCPEARELGLYQTELGLKKSKKLEAVIFRTKEAIFERALKDNPFSAALKLAQLDCMQDYWDSGVLQKHWKELAARNLTNINVWMKYLDYVESKSTSFTISGLLKIYKKCFFAMKRSMEKGLNAVNFLIDLFVRLCFRLGQAGQNERAVALYQALLEYNIYAPGSDLVPDCAVLMDYFTAFWESSAPRLGEDKSHGWCHWMKHQGNIQPSQPLVSKDEDDALEQNALQKSGEKSTMWMTIETLRSSRHWLPWRPDENGSYEDCEDPERLVLSDDLTFALFSVNTSLQKLKLLCSFLEFLGVPNPQSYSTSSQVCAADDITAIKLQTISEIFQGPAHESYTAKCHRYRDVALVNRQKFILNIFSQTMPIFKNAESTCMKLFLMYVDFLEWGLALGRQTWCSAEQKTHVKEARSCMKKLLAEEPYRTSTWAWLRYGQMEWKLGRMEDTRKALYHTVTSLANSSYTKNYPHCMAYKLYRVYAELEVGFVPPSCLFIPQNDSNLKHSGSNMQKALQILVSLCEGSWTNPSDEFSINTAQLLKCKRHYQDNLMDIIHKLKDAEFSNDEDMYIMYSMGSSLEDWVSCAELFVYITSGLKAANELHENVKKYLDDILSQLMDTQNDRCNMITHIKQAIIEAHLSLLKLHLKREYAHLRTIQTPLLDALKEQPNNVNIMWSYIQLELKSSFTGNMRRYLSRECKKTKSPLVWTLSLVAHLLCLEQLQKANMDALKSVAIVPEALVALPEMGIVHTVRTWFQWATSGPVCRHNLLIWRLYLKFEIQYGKPDIAKRVFYDAVQHCPWAKSLYMDFVHANPASTQELVDLMMEREIRVHLPMEELDILLGENQEEGENLS